MLKRQKGQGLVEFALISPVLLLTILAIIETALIFQGYLTVQHAAREAARWAVTYKPDRGMQLDGSPCDYVSCDPGETEQEYWTRRVEFIKLIARQRAVGLRIDDAHLGLTDSDFAAYLDLPNFYGVEVWGFPSFVAPDGGWTDTDLRNHPGLPGLPVRVRVTHNVELLDPLFRAIVPRVRVVAQTEMINEGTQAGYGNVAPPALPPPPPLPVPDPSGGITIVDFDMANYVVDESVGTAIITVEVIPPVDEVVTVNYVTSDGTATEGVDYHQSSGVLAFDPFESSKTFTVDVVNDDIAPPQDGAAETVILTLSGGNADIGPNNPATLTIIDDDGSAPKVEFERVAYSVDEDESYAVIDVILTAPSGQTIRVDYATADGTATAGSDYTAAADTLIFDPSVTQQSFVVPILDDAVNEADETVTLELSNPVNAAIGINNPATLTILDTDVPPTATPTGPFITVSDYQVYPTQWVLIDVNQHPYSSNPYELVWVDSGGTVQQVISATLRVDPDGFKRGIPFPIPTLSAGVYYVETRGAVGARSDEIQVIPPPPDLVVRSITLAEDVLPNEEITATVEIQNVSAGSASGYFDVDLYVDPTYPPVTNRPGTSKQWVLGIDPFETKVVTHVVTLYGGGAHELWAQVDTSDWVQDELSEDNNILGPIVANANAGECEDENGNVLTDRFSGRWGPDPDPKWSSAMLGNATIHDMVVDEAEGTLSITANGTNLWNSPDGGATFMYQPVSGDFVATLKVIQDMQGSAQQWAKIGLMARDTTQDNSRWVMVVKARDVVQSAFRTGTGAQRFASDVPAGTPVWVRLMRSGDTFSAYYSGDGNSWVPMSGDGENGGVTVDMGESMLIGIAATSYSSNPATGIVDDFEVCFLNATSETCQGYSDDFEADSLIVWSDSDVGTTLPGSSSKSGGTMTVYGDGATLWSSDNFHYTYQQVSGNFVATLKINSGPGQNEWSKAGLMVRASTAQDSAHVMVMKTRDYGIQFGRRAADGGPNERFASDTGSSPLPVWVRIARNGNAVSAFYSTDGDNWTFGNSTSVDLAEDVLIGMAVSSYSGTEVGSGNFDDFLFCAGEAGDVAPPVLPPDDKPPGLKECVQTIELGNFEASIITPPWQRNADAYHASDHKHSGNFALEFRASVGPRPEYKHLKPWAYQAVDVPGDVLPETSGRLSYWEYIIPDPEDAAQDADDRFLLAVRDSAGVTHTADIPLAQGDTNTPVFRQRVISVETYMGGNGIADFSGQQMQVFFYGVHDGDDSGTSFYIDDVRFDICTVQPIPDDVPGTASIGGLIEVLLDARPTKMPGIQVWAYAPGGAFFNTKTIHDSTYHFYNVPPGTYTVYAEVWTDNVLYTATTEVTVVADERNYGVHLLLQ
jgi:regulation of enolase protein 1 (concanavalin A-like superfamily)